VHRQEITSNFRCGNIPEFIGARDAEVSYKILRNAPHEEGSAIAARVAAESAGERNGARQSFKYRRKIKRSIDRLCPSALRPNAAGNFETYRNTQDSLRFSNAAR